MSHFSVMVIGENVEAQLQPYHEFECTGIDDEYVQDIDITEEAREYFDKHTEEVLRGPDGKLHQFFDGEGSWRIEFSEPDPEAPSYRPDQRRRRIPDGFTLAEVPTSQVESFAEFTSGYYGTKVVGFGEQPDKAGAHKYGYILVDGSANVVKVIDRTNPHKTWDWFQIGGRWSNFLKLKPGVMGFKGKRSWTNKDDPDDSTRCDAAHKSNIDIEFMRNESGDKAAALWDKVRRIIGEQTWESWESARARFEKIEDARTFYQGQAAVMALKEADQREFGWDLDDALAGERDTYVQAERDRAICTYALVMDGKWYSKGRMGWFGSSSDEISQEEWNRKVNDLIDSLPDDTLMTVVDCHI